MNRPVVWLVVVLSAWSCGSSRSGSKKDVVGGGGSEVQSSTEPDVPAPLGPPQTAVGCLREQVCAGVQGGREDCEPGERCNTTLAVPKCQKLYCAGVGESCDPSVGDSLCEKGLGCTSSGQCRAPECGGRECGPDAYGFSCGECGGGLSCSAEGQCVCPDPLKTGATCSECKDPLKTGATCSECKDPLGFGELCKTLDLELTEVTVSAYGQCVNAGECTTPDSGGACNWGVAGREQHPVNCVDWFQATAYCAWSGGRLPTEFEWEFAATNWGTTDEPWGSGAATCTVAVMVEGDDGCGEGRTWPVCSKPAGNTQAGHCDLAGNVWEWTSTKSRSFRVLRGGSWIHGASLVGATARVEDVPSRRYFGLGFRCLRD
jgi:sulfatase modifying factor 1